MGVQHIIAGIVGAGIVATVVHASIAAGGGYDNPAAWITVALGCGLIAGAISVGICWRERRYGLGFAILACLLAGEAYTLLLTAERTTAAREAKQAPLREDLERRRQAIKTLAEAEAALAGLSDTPRLTRAIAAKAEADTTAQTKAAERSCAANCRALLETQVAEAAKELEAARVESDQVRSAALQRVSSARLAVASLPLEISASPLADRIGVDPGKLDLAAAALASIAANGLAACLLAFASHARREKPVPVIVPAEAPLAASAPIEASPTIAVIEQASAAAEPITEPAQIGEAERKAESERDVKREANAFAVTAFRPADDGAVLVSDIKRAYRDWCTSRSLEPLPDQEIAGALRDLFARVGLEVEHAGSQRKVLGITWSEKMPRLAA